MNKINTPIGVLDSGVGGWTILREMRRRLPRENFVYFADGRHNPYGEKSPEELWKIVSGAVRFLIDEKEAKMVVLACNTATTRCIERLREIFVETVFVGTEPAIKVACDHGARRTLVLATPATVEAERTGELVQRNRREGQEVELVACEGLAATIERAAKIVGEEVEINDWAEIEAILTEIKERLGGAEFDAVVLGCTHYSLIKGQLRKLFPRAKLVDGAKGVAMEVERQLEQREWLGDEEGKIEVAIDTDGDL